ncbi:glycosyl hydrolase family 28 protein [Rheinheimera sp.]|uniref:glycosyl hydrolase family 28 protein n=1 Tax=Rheinheimera sp. TaxID=1869214 RepID=UPI00307CCA9A
MDRRDFLKSSLALTAPVVLSHCSSAGPAVELSGLELLWQQADAIEASVQPVTIPPKIYQASAHQVQVLPSQAEAIQAVSLARHNRQALQALIDLCHQQGGGRVLLSAGVWPCGAIRLKSNVELHLAKDALLQFVPEPELYLPYVHTRWEGMELMGYQPLIYAYQATNIAVTGLGRIDGGGSNQHWWPWKGAWKHTPWQVNPEQEQKAGRDLLMQMTEQGLPVEQRVLTPNFLRPPLLQTYDCQQVRIEGLTLTNSPFWLIHPVLTQDLTVRNVKCISHGPNSDGCDPESCQRVLIEGCEFDTGDDCIALKSGRNADGRRFATPVQQVLIQDCVMKAGHGGVVLGSEISGGAHAIFARRLVMSSPDLDRGLRIKTNALRGGEIDTVALRDIVIGQVKDAIVINYFYEEGRDGAFLPQVRNVSLHNVEIGQAERLFELRGFAEAPIGLIQLSKVTARALQLGVLEQVSEIRTQQVQLNGEAWQHSPQS